MADGERDNQLINNANPDVQSRFGIGMNERESDRSCWICFANEDDNPLAIWVHPCRCSGSTKWVHQSCLYRWIDEKQKGNLRRPVVCQQCQTEYIIIFPKMSPVARILETIDYVVRRSSPYVATVMLLGYIYLIAITYGAVTVVQVLGHERGIELMEKGDPVFLLIGLPLIPVGLVLTRFIRWEDAILRMIRSRHSLLRKFPLIKWLMNSEHELNVDDNSNNGIVPAAPTPIITEPFYLSRLFCGGILLPTLAILTGKIFFQNITNPLHRTLLGGVTFVTIKGILKIYLRQKQYIRRRRRRIVDYTDENVRIYVNRDQSISATVRQDAGHDDHISDEDTDADSKDDNESDINFDDDTDSNFEIDDTDVDIHTDSDI